MENIVVGIEGYVGTGKTSVCKKLRYQILFCCMVETYTGQLHMVY